MLRKGRMQTVAFLLAALLLAGAPLAAAGSGGLQATQRQETEGAWAHAWDWLASIWAAAACKLDAGMCIDPNGGAALVCGGDRGGCIDPDG